MTQARWSHRQMSCWKCPETPVLHGHSAGRLTRSWQSPLCYVFFCEHVEGNAKILFFKVCLRVFVCFQSCISSLVMPTSPISPMESQPDLLNEKNNSNFPSNKMHTEILTLTQTYNLLNTQQDVICEAYLFCR